MRTVLSAAILAVILSASGCGDQPANAPPAPKQAAKANVSPSAQYFHRVEMYLAPVTLTEAEKAAVEKLEAAAAPQIDAEATHATAVAALHKAILAALTDEQRSALKAAHAREKSDVVFSPVDDVESKILDELRKAKKTVQVAAFGIDSPKIAAELVRLRAAGKDVTVYLDRTQAAGRGSQLDALRRGNVTTFIKHKRYLMHDKYMIIDDREVITGSYNFSKRAAKQDNNLEVIKDSSRLVRKFEADFRRMLKEAGPHPDAETAKKIEEAATKIAAAVETAKAKAEAWAKAEAAWEKALSEADVDATGAVQAAARRNAARAAIAGAKAAEEAWTKAATAEEAWANAENVWAQAARDARPRQYRHDADLYSRRSRTTEGRTPQVPPRA